MTVSFHLTTGEDHDHQPLWNRLREWRAKQVLDSEWLIACPTMSPEIYDEWSVSSTPMIGFSFLA
jgi:hypothetical protein